MNPRVSTLALALALVAASTAPAAAQYNGVPKSGVMTKGTMPASVTPEELKKVQFEQKLGVQVPLDLPFRDETGAPVQLSKYFTGKPVVLALVYYECPMLCVQALNGLVKAMRVVGLEPGKDYTVVTVSFNPKETPAQAAEKKAYYLKLLKRDGGQAGWHFLTGDQPAIALLTGTIGFHYVFDAPTKQYAHPTGIIVLTPEGLTSKYIYGIDYGARDLRFALVEASNHQVGTPVDALLLYCYHYDPASGKYGLVLLNVIRLGAVVTVFSLGSFILIMWRREKRRPAPPETQVNN